MIKELQGRIKEFQNTKTDSEENLKFHVTTWVLTQLGYDTNDFDLEHPLCRRKGNDRRADIYIPIKGNGEQSLFVETKKLSKDLDESDLQQLLGYMHDKHLIWGILTNGREYYLLNDMIMSSKPSGDKSAVLDRVVLYVDIDSQKNIKYLKYFQKNNIFDNCSTRFYRDIAQFFAYQNYPNNSRIAYENTLYGFFDYYIGKGNYYNKVAEIIHRPIEEVRQSDFVEYLLTERPAGRPTEGGLPLAKVSHISTMYKVLNDNAYISKNDFVNLRNYVKTYFDNAKKEKDYNVLSDENITLCVQGLLSSRSSKKWNKLAIFIMCSYYGFNLRTIKEFFALTWDEIDLQNGIFVFHEKQYKMPPLLIRVLTEIRAEYVNKKLKARTIYINKFGTVKLSSDTIHDIFKECHQILNDNQREVEAFTTTIICPAVYRKLFFAGYSLEEIAVYCNTNVMALASYISDEDIEIMGKRKMKNRLIKDKHPLANNFQ